MPQPKIQFRVIQGGKAGPAAAGSSGSVRQVLRRVLDARLSPTLTVEQASHLNSSDLESELPSMETFLADITALHAAGLDALIQLDDLPEAVVLTDPERFQARFPELADVVPVMLAYGGVQPYTDGIPRKLHADRPRRQASALSLV